MFQAIPAAASSPMAFAAYALAVVSTTIVALKTKRNRQLLKHLGDLPARERLKALELEMGSVRVPKGLTPEQWLRSRIHYYLFVGFGVLSAVVLVVAVVALTSRPPPGKLDIGWGLYAPRPDQTTGAATPMDPAKTKR
jgi:hypothetical protein